MVVRTIGRVGKRLFILCQTHIDIHKVFQFVYITVLETKTSIYFRYSFEYSY